VRGVQQRRESLQGSLTRLATLADLSPQAGRGEESEA
jgi:hypothetical protein